MVKLGAPIWPLPTDIPFACSSRFLSILSRTLELLDSDDVWLINVRNITWLEPYLACS